MPAAWQSGGRCRFSGGDANPVSFLAVPLGATQVRQGRAVGCCQPPCPVPGKCPVAVHALPATPSPTLEGWLPGPDDPGACPTPVPLLPWGWCH